MKSSKELGKNLDSPGKFLQGKELEGGLQWTWKSWKLRKVPGS
jgi:hypothetical protein